MTESLGSPAEQEALLAFWFDPQHKEKWFRRDDDFDAELRQRFGDLHAAAAEGRLDAWRETPRGSLAVVILLDQLTRNFHRGTPEAFANDPTALVRAAEAIERGFDRELGETERVFLYMPFEHSELLADQERGVELMGRLSSDPQWLKFAVMHRDLIARFGRFPHRNAVLERESTVEEADFLKEPNSSF
ncbi:MAG: DUF924 family protein [Rhodovibrionaceae bacterium]